MKALKSFLLKAVAIIALIMVALFIFDYDYLLKAVRTIYFTGHKTAYLEDYKKFDNTVIKSGIQQPWALHSNYNEVELSEAMREINEQYETVAFLVIKNDSILFEKYYDGFGEESKSNSFSMAKSFVSAMLGKAIKDGYIESLEQPVGDFIPEYAEGEAGEMTVGDLASMASGLNWDENYYSPFSVTTRAYFDEDLGAVMRNRGASGPPGASYKYLSGNTQLLAMVLEEATGMELEQYLSKSFWKPLGMQTDALWQVDSDEHGLVKAYCCIASNAKDFAKLGRLYKDYGKWNGEQLLDSAFVAKSINPRFEGEPYGYGFWLTEFEGKEVFMMRGHLGQYVIVVPKDDIIVVRLGHGNAGFKRGGFPKTLDYFIAEAYKMTSHDQ